MSALAPRRFLTLLTLAAVTALILQGGAAHAVAEPVAVPPTAVEESPKDGEFNSDAGEFDDPAPEPTDPNPAEGNDTGSDADVTPELREPALPPAEPGEGDGHDGVPAQPEASVPHGTAVTSGYRSAGDEAVIFAEVNRARLSYCQPILYRNGAIDQVARNWSSTQLATGEYHHNPNYLTQIPAYWVAGGENIYRGPATGMSAFHGWMASPGHRENILNEAYSDIGIGFVRAADGSTHTTQVFAGYTKHQGGVFLDVRPWSSFFREINWMGTSKLSTGNRLPGCGSKATYNPKSQVSREAMAAFLYRLANAKFTPPKVSPFSDVQPGHKFYREITWMHAQGLSTGNRVPGGKPRFAPGESVSREAMAAFLYRFQNAKYTAPSTSPFADVQRGDKFYREIAWMRASKVSTGNAQPTGKPKYLPKDRVSREAMAAFIYRVRH